MINVTVTIVGLYRSEADPIYNWHISSWISTSGHTIILYYELRRECAASLYDTTYSVLTLAGKRAAGELSTLSKSSLVSFKYTYPGT